jgi:hypothetical protein
VADLRCVFRRASRKEFHGEDVAGLNGSIPRGADIAQIT